MVCFEVSNSEARLINTIAVRAMKMAVAIDAAPCTLLELDMDLTACHANGTPLKLLELATASDGDFGHDVFGIHRHLNRETGEIENCFLPRYAK